MRWPYLPPLEPTLSNLAEGMPEAMIWISFACFSRSLSDPFTTLTSFDNAVEDHASFLNSHHSRIDALIDAMRQQVAQAEW